MTRKLLSAFALVCLMAALLLTPAALAAEDEGQSGIAGQEEAAGPEVKAPEATKKPEKTKAPEQEAAKEPETTKAPEQEAEKEPETTKAPEQEAEKEPETTKAPEPEATKEPEKTTKPETTETPAPDLTETAAPETTEMPAPDMTETAAPETTETPAPETTETPAPDATETPVPDMTETPAPDATETPMPDMTETPVPDMTETDAPNATETPVPDMTETPAPETTETSVPDMTETPAPDMTETPVPDATETPAPETTETPVPDMTETPVPEASATPEPTNTPEPVKELSLSVSSSTEYAFAGEDSIKFSVKIRGGKGPYTIRIRLYNIYEDETVSRAETEQDDEGTYVFRVKPKDFGVHRVEVTVTDARGEEKKGSVKVPVPIRERESDAKWKKSVRGAKLTGDWGNDLVEIARTQLGYKESARNYIIENGNKIGYTRYGAWYGADYGKWCAMFVAFCAEYAGISGKDMPRDSNVRDLYNEVKAAGALEHESYQPQTGDLVFFNWKHGTEYDHVGIVESFDGEDVHTIEGNSSNRVRRRHYDHDDTEIIGYCNTAKLMEKAGVVKEK